MKRLIKGMLIISGVLALLGLVLIIIGFMLGASWGEMVDAVTSRTSNYFDKDWDILDEDSVDSESYDVKEIDNLVIDIGAGKVDLVGGDSDQIHVKNDDSKGKLSADIKGDTLYIKTRGKRFSHTGGKATITIPKDISFKSVNIEMSAGFLDLESLDTEQLDVDVTAGDLEGSGQLIADSSSWKISAGEISVDSLDCNDTRLDCTAGNLEMVMAGDEEDYKLGGKITAGDLQYDNDDFDWGDLERGPHDALRKIDIDCTAGSIDIDFED